MHFPIRTRELYPNDPTTASVDEQTRRQFEFSPLHQLVRSWVRKTYGGGDIVDDVIRVAEIGVNDSIVDLGCGDGSFLEAVADRAGNIGPKVGVELSETTVTIAKRRLSQAANDGNKSATSIKVIKGDIQETLPLRPNSANLASLFNVIYHTSNPEKVANKLYRVLQPGGKVIVVTKEVGDLGKGWEWVGEEAPRYFMEQYPEMKAPIPFYVHCGPERTQEIFDKKFERVYPKDSHSLEYINQSVRPLKIYGEDAWTDYMYVLLSICEELDPKPSPTECRRFINDVLRPKFDAEIEEKGYVEDWAKQFIFIYKKPENTYFNLLKFLKLVNNNPQFTNFEFNNGSTRQRSWSLIGKSLIPSQSHNETKP